MTIIKKQWFRGQQGELRNGWWMLIFMLLVFLSRPLFSWVDKNLEDLGVSELLLEPLPFLFILIITWFCIKLRQQEMADVGLQFNGQWQLQALVGLILGGIQMILVITGIWLVGGVELKLSSVFSFEPLLIGFYTMLFGVLMEEVLFRGFLFQRAIDGLGFIWAQLIFAFIFAIGHVSDPELSLSVQFWAGLDIALGAMVFGLAYFKTKSLALPIGLHLGWNWFQGYLLGFSVSGNNQQGVIQPVLQQAPSWLNGGDFGPEATVFAACIDLVLLIALWRWKGSVIRTNEQNNLVTKAALTKN